MSEQYTAATGMGPGKAPETPAMPIPGSVDGRSVPAPDSRRANGGEDSGSHRANPSDGLRFVAPKSYLRPLTALGASPASTSADYARGHARMDSSSPGAAGQGMHASQLDREQTEGLVSAFALQPWSNDRASLDRSPSHGPFSCHLPLTCSGVTACYTRISEGAHKL